MQSTALLSENALNERILQDNHGFFTASLLLMKIQAGVKLIMRNQEIMLNIPDDVDEKPNLHKRIVNFKAYASEIKFERFVSKWCKHIGGIAVPWNSRNGHIHLYMIDDGLLSRSIPPVPELNYKERSAFFLNRVLGLEKEFHRLKGKIHMHVICAKDLDQDDNIMSVKRCIAREHESSGNFIEGTSMLAFSLRENCQYGHQVSGAEELVTNEPDWFRRQIPKWKM